MTKLLYLFFTLLAIGLILIAVKDIKKRENAAQTALRLENALPVFLPFGNSEKNCLAFNRIKENKNIILLNNIFCPVPSKNLSK